MLNKFWLCACFCACLCVGFACGMYAGTHVGARDNISNAISELVQKNKSNLLCVDGTSPDKNGCCADEIYTDMGDLGYNCCPPGQGDCFPPIK